MRSHADHISALRTFLLAAGPWVKAVRLVTACYSQVDIVRTIKATLGLPPLSQWDANARILGGLWRKRPGYAPYAAKPFAVPRQLNARRCRSRWLDLRRKAGADGSALAIK